MNVEIYPTLDNDKDFFFRLRNDPVTCRMSRRGKITQEEHDVWWAKTQDHRFIILADRAYAGYVRIGPDGTLSIALDNLYRGLGIGTQALWQIRKICGRLGYRRIFAEIAPENAASQKAFLKAGWSPVLFEVTP